MISVVVLVVAGSLVWALSRHTPAAGHGGRGTGQKGAGTSQSARAAAATRNLAAAWVAGQVSRADAVSCDPVMCQALKSHGVMPRDLNQLRPDTTSPLGSSVIVATAVVRAQFGSLLRSVYAPATIASFGSGPSRIEIRQITPHGAAAYWSQFHADLQVRKASGAELLHVNRIVASRTARRQLFAGQVDSRLLVVIASMASVHPVYLVAFGNDAPGADAGMPLRFVYVARADVANRSGSQPVTVAFVRSMVAVLRAENTLFRPAHIARIQLAGGQAVLRIEFAAPSPLDLLGAQNP